MKTRIFKGFFGVMVAAGLMVGGSAHASNLTQQQAQAIIQMVQSFGADASTLNSVSVALGVSGYGYGSGYSYGGYASPACPALSYDLYFGLYDTQTAGQVSQLQRYLGVTPTGYFGTLTRQAVANFQQQYSVYPITGGVGPLTRAKMVQLCGGNGYPTPTPYPYQYGTISITGVSGPNTLAINQQGTWTVSTNAPSGSSVSLSVNWGDQNSYPYASLANAGYTNQQNTFTHTYGYPGTYTVVFTATDNNSHSNTASATVVVGGSNTCNTYGYGNSYCNTTPTITSISPTQGVVGTQVTITGSGFTSDNTIHFGSGGAMHVSSYSGTQLTFIIPSSVGPCSFVGDTSPIRCFAADQLVTAGNYPIYVSNNNGQSSSVIFAVTGTNQNSSLQITSPLAGATYYRGQDMPINWNWNVGTPVSNETVTLDLYTSAGTDVGTIAIPTLGSGSYTWHIPGFPQNYMCTMQYPNGLCGTNIPTGQYYIQATLQNYSSAYTYTQPTTRSGVFTINQQ